MNRVLLALTVLLLPCSVAIAAGLGKLTVLSALGQPLKAEIEIVALQPGEGDGLSARLAAVESFRQAGVELNGVLLNVRFAVERRPNGQHVVSIVSNQPINEPFIDLLVELNWANGKLTREYTFLLDPPEYKGPAVATAAQPISPPAAQVLPAPARAEPAAVPRAPAQESPAPARAAAQAPAIRSSAPAPSGESTYTVKRGDTLVKIAQQTMPAGVTLHQALVALYRGNQDAFVGNNMNRLSAGKILTIPAREAAGSVTVDEARKIVDAQSEAYQEFRNKIGAAVAAAPARPESGRQAAGRISAPRADRPVPAADAGRDQLRLSKPDAAKAGGRAGGGKGDDIAAKDKALREANERIALLEKNLQDLQKLAQIKSGAAAQLQASAQTAVAPKPATPVPAQSADAAKTAAASKAEPEKGDAAKKSEPVKEDATKAAAPAAATTDASSTAPVVAKPTPKPSAKAVIPPAPPPQPSFIEELVDDPVAMGAGAAVILGLFGYAYYALRKKRKMQAANASSAANSEMAALSAAALDVSSVPGTGVGSDSEMASVDTDISSAGFATGDSEEVDPLAEADVYMAYGRDTQAEEILKEALAKDSNRPAIKVKLLEIYAGRKDSASFELVATDLRETTGGTGPDWERTVALGLALDPDNPLYGGSSAAARMDMASTQILNVADLAPAAATRPEPDLLVEDSGTEAGPDRVAEDSTTEAAPDTSAGLDFDLDLGAEAPETPQQPEEDGLAAPAGEEATLGGMDFDLDLGGDKPEETSIKLPAEALQAAEAGQHDPAVANADEITVEAGDAASAGLDFDFDLPGEENKAEETTAPANADSGLDFDLGGDKVDAPPGEEKHAEVDLSAISFDLGSPGNGSGEATVVDAHWQEVATKLDLAKAYQDMGDKDGARELLNEVMNEGDGTQQSQAKSLLETLGA